MNTQDSDSTTVTSVGNPFKLLILLAGGALACSLLAVILTAILLLRPVEGKIDEGNSAIKEAIDANAASTAKMMGVLRDACVDWQAVLKKASEKPDTVFKIEKMPDGYLTLKEIE